LAPFAPHISEELWSQLGQTDSIHISSWPAYDEQFVVSDKLTIVVQVNGKVRADFEVAPDATEAEITALASSHDRVKLHLKDQKIKRTVYVTGKLVNFVV
jgi:leucyl-tRNA synthetase